MPFSVFVCLLVFFFFCPLPPFQLSQIIITRAGGRAFCSNINVGLPSKVPFLKDVLQFSPSLTIRLLDIYVCIHGESKIELSLKVSPWLNPQLINIDSAYKRCKSNPINFIN